MPDYPECEKLKKVSIEHSNIMEFLDWLDEEKSIRLCECDQSSTSSFSAYAPITTSKEKLLAEYFNLDLKKIEEERRAMIEEIRARQDELLK